MATNRIINLSSLPKIIQEGGYKFISLADNQGRRIVAFNPVSTKSKGYVSLEDNINKIVDKMNNNILSPGRYTILLSDRLGKGFIADEFTIIKDHIQPEQSGSPSNPIVIHHPAEKKETISHAEALELTRSSAKIEAEVEYLRNENKLLHEKNKELERQIEELQEEIEEEIEKEKQAGLSAAPQGGAIAEMIKDYAPALFGAINQHFSLEEQKIELQKRSLNNTPAATHQQAAEQQSAKAKIKVQVAPGSMLHLQQIDAFYKAGNEKRFIEEVERIQDPAIIDNLIQKYQLTRDPNDN